MDEIQMEEKCLRYLLPGKDDGATGKIEYVAFSDPQSVRQSLMDFLSEARSAIQLDNKYILLPYVLEIQLDGWRISFPVAMESVSFTTRIPRRDPKRNEEGVYRCETWAVSQIYRDTLGEFDLNGGLVMVDGIPAAVLNGMRNNGQGRVTVVGVNYGPNRYKRATMGQGYYYAADGTKLRELEGLASQARSIDLVCLGPDSVKIKLLPLAEAQR